MAECHRSQSRAVREKQLKTEHAMRQYPHDPDHPGEPGQLCHVYMMAVLVHTRATEAAKTD